MAVFRVDKNRGYTVMSNYHLKDKSISLKAKGLLSMILSLPDEWNYTTRGLAAICKEGVESIGTTLKELETVGYLGREQVRDERGRIKDVEYTIYERPQKKQADKEKGKPGTGKEKKDKVDTDDGESEQKDADDPGAEHSDTDKPDTDEPDTGEPDTGHPDTDLPDTGFPDMDNPDTDLPDTENPAQLNTNRSNPHKSNPHGSKSYPYPSNQGRENGDGCDSIESPVRAWDMELMIGHVQVDINYFDLLEEFSKDQLDELVELIAEMRCKKSGTVNIGGTMYSADAVRERFEKLTSRHIRYVIEAMNNNRTKVRNIKKYLIAALFNAPVTVGNYYRAEYNHKYGDEEDLFEDIV